MRGAGDDVGGLYVLEIVFVGTDDRRFARAHRDHVRRDVYKRQAGFRAFSPEALKSDAMQVSRGLPAVPDSVMPWIG